jgi:hypothetical protein
MFAGARIVMLAAGSCHSAAITSKVHMAACGYSLHSVTVTEDDVLYTWGRGKVDCVDELDDAPDVPTGLGHIDMLHTIVPTRIAPHYMQSARVGHSHRVPLKHVLAFALGTLPRLGMEWNKEWPRLSIHSWLGSTQDFRGVGEALS